MSDSVTIYCRCLTVGEINAPKNNVSKNVNSNDPGNSLTAAYINEPISSAEMVVPTIAYVKMAPKFLKKYFCWRNENRKYWKGSLINLMNSL